MDSWADLTDEQLIRYVQSGHTDAYGELVRRYQRAVYNTAYRLLGEQQEALDATQEACVRAYNALDSFDRARPFEPWIRRIATNIALNLLKRKRVPTVPLANEWQDDDMTHAVAPPDYSTEPEQVYLAGERQALLRQAIQELPPHYRAVIELRHFQELAYDEIAATLAIPLSDVKSHLFRARQLLRTRLTHLRAEL